MVLTFTIKVMATREDKYKDNVKGKFYVDTECIDCNLCRELAPENFTNHEDGYSYVYKQPKDQGEADACLDAMENCPVEAIGDDGQD